MNLEIILKVYRLFYKKLLNIQTALMLKHAIKSKIKLIFFVGSLIIIHFEE